MAAFPAYEITDLEHFANVPEGSFTEYGDIALDQAQLIVQSRTLASEYPANANLQKAFDYAILDVAVFLYYQSYYMQYRSIPMQSESIGGYSYSKQLQDINLYGTPTGLRWLDYLLDLLSKLKAEDILGPAGGYGISGDGVHVFEYDDVYSVNGNKWVLGPKNAPVYPRGSQYSTIGPVYRRDEDPTEPPPIVPVVP